MPIRVDPVAVRDVNVAGRGGKEAMLRRVFPGLQPEGEPLWDATDPITGVRVEFKKQANLQWFDIGKYHGLTDDEQRIRMVFILHHEGVIDQIFSLDLGDMLRILTRSPDHNEDGWSRETIAEAKSLKDRHPRLQLKVPLKVRQFFKSHEGLPEVDRLYP